MFKQSIQFSPYLSQLFDEHHTHPLLNQPELTAAELENLNTQLLNDSSSFIDNTQECMLQLRKSKQLFSLIWSICYLNKSISQQQAGKLQSKFAQTSIQIAFQTACHEKEFINFVDKNCGIIPGIFVLGLGKLGGQDLNFSSDVDLVAFYDNDTISIAERLGRTHIVSKLLARMSYILNHNTAQGFVWRVDWRLRPNASVKYLSMPAHQAINFYYFQSQPWHRLAMIKAVVVGGDYSAGESFLNDLQAYLWKRNLDFRAIDEIASLKSRINQEHPRLKKQREQQKTNTLSTLDGFNFKLGHGGIREIEFIINAMQLIWAGKKPTLRNTHTLTSLQALAQEQLIAAELAEQLTAAYLLLRRCEDALQMLHNQQTHSTPGNTNDKTLWLNLLSTSEESLSESLNNHRAIVSNEFTQLFNTDADTPCINFSWATIEDSLNERSQTIVSDWEQGFLVYGALPSQSSQLRPLAQLLGEVIVHSDLDINQSITKVDAYLRKLPAGGQYLSLLQRNPQLLKNLISPLLLSPAMAILLEQSPHIIDCFLEQPSNNANAVILDRDYILNETDHETALEKLRRHTNEEKYKFYLDYLNNTISSRTLEQRLTQLAEAALALALELSSNYLKLDSGSFSIIGLGKLGMQTLMPRSDLDLMYLFDEGINVEQANKIASHLNIVLHSNMREGRVYELDTRLRPSGRSGSPTISMQSFSNYQHTQAFNWEHLALFPARFITGSNEVKDQFCTIRNHVLSKPRCASQWKMDTLKMLTRIHDQRINQHADNAFISKLRAGGLMQAEYMLACIAIEHAPDNLEILTSNYLETANAIDMLVDLDFLSSLNFWRDLQIAIRIFGHESTPIDNLPKPVLTLLLQHLSISSQSQLAEAINTHSHKIEALTHDYFLKEHHAQLTDWKESSVQWI